MTSSHSLELPPATVTLPLTKLCSQRPNRRPPCRPPFIAFTPNPLPSPFTLYVSPPPARRPGPHLWRFPRTYSLPVSRFTFQPPLLAPPRHSNTILHP